MSKTIAGTYTGTGKYMPHLQTIGAKTLTCTIPDWAGTLKSGNATAVVTVINDTSVNIVLGGSTYSAGYNNNFTLAKNGNTISDSKGIVQFLIDSKLFKLAFSVAIVQFGGGCTAANRYYYVSEGPVTVPATPRYSYASVGIWEFSGTK